MKTLGKIKSLLQKEKTALLILFFLSFCQLFYSFLFPSYNPEAGCWKTIEKLNFYKGYTFDLFDNQIAAKIYPVVANYHLNCDGGGHILLAHDFPQHYFRGHLVFLNRPLYPFLISLVSQPFHLISNSYSLTFAAAIFLNFILFLLTVFLFFSLVKKIISARVAFLSSILLILSPFAHIWLIQPETNIFGAFSIILSLFLLHNYISRPSLKKLILFSLISGILMLGKMIFAVSFFILFLALCFKRFKEGILFLIFHLLPLVFWYLWVTQVFQLGYFVAEVSDFGMGIWLLDIFKWPWYKVYQTLLSVLPQFISSLIYGFLLVPLIFVPFGFGKLSLPRKNIFFFGLIFAFLILSFVMNFYIPRHAFLLFPIIYPLAVLGMDRTADFLKKYKNWYSLVFYWLVFVLLIVISNVNILKVFPYDCNIPPLIF